MKVERTQKFSFYFSANHIRMIIGKHNSVQLVKKVLRIGKIHHRNTKDVEEFL